MSVGVGLSLAIAMIVAEQQFGFNLRSFGPIAAGILVLLFGVMIYQLLRCAGMTRFGSASVAYIIIFIALLGLSPDLLKWLASEAQ